MQVTGELSTDTPSLASEIGDGNTREPSAVDTATAATAGGPSSSSSSKKMKVRRDPNEIRTKGSSKYAKLWKNLKKPIANKKS